MNIRIPATALALACALPLAGCRDNPDAPSVTNTSAAEAGTTMPRTESSGGTANPHTGDSAMQSQSEGERSALGVLNAINDYEIAAGRQALEKNVSGDVADYAQQMIDAHTQNKAQTNALNPDAESANAKAQAAKGEQMLQHMADKSGDDYRRAYVDAMIVGHTQALAMLDDTLIPAVASPQAKAHVQQTRQHVARHLSHARALDKSDNSVPGDKTSEKNATP